MADGYVTSPVGPFHTAVGASFGTFTTRQDVSPTPVPVILPYQLRVGSRINVKAYGEFSSTGTPTLVLGVYTGSGVGASGAPSAITTVLAETTTMATNASAAWPWALEFTAMVTVVGTSGQLVGTGVCEAGTSLTAMSDFALPATQALRTVTFNTSVANAIGICATWSASSASNTVKVNNLSVTLLN